MTIKLTLATAASVLFMLLPGCGKVEQVKPPTFTDTGEADMEAEPEKKELQPNVISKADAKDVCSELCVKALANDKTGQTPDQIPCVDFTAELSEDCLSYFRKNPLKASEAQEHVRSLKTEDKTEGKTEDKTEGTTD